MGRLVIAAVTSVAIALAGCQVSTSPKTVSTLSEHDAPSLTRAPWSGTLTLYRNSPGRDAPKTVVQTIHLKKADPLGFRVRESGVVAVAGDLELPVSDGTYQWVMTADPGQTDPVATGILVTVSIVVIVVLAATIFVIYEVGQASLARGL